uniref:Saposin B-type domain-containing protein n=1 Tax=Heterorhabditis bacteriophora TaxID=37862 RepID=A0A1I7WH82_HETBA
MDLIRLMQSTEMICKICVQLFLKLLKCLSSEDPVERVAQEVVSEAIEELFQSL